MPDSIIKLIWSGDDGVVEFGIKNGEKPLRRYTYRVPIYIKDRINQLSRRAAGKALNLAKKYGQLIGN